MRIRVFQALVGYSTTGAECEKPNELVYGFIVGLVRESALVGTAVTCPTKKGPGVVSGKAVCKHQGKTAATGNGGVAWKCVGHFDVLS